MTCKLWLLIPTKNPRCLWAGDDCVFESYTTVLTTSTGVAGQKAAVKCARFRWNVRVQKQPRRRVGVRQPVACKSEHSFIKSRIRAQILEEKNFNLHMSMKGKCTEKPDKEHSRIVYWQLIPAGPENPEELVTVTCNSKMLSARLFSEKIFYFISLLFAMGEKN